MPITPQHEILPSSDPKSKTAHANIPATCSTCHGQKFAMAKAGLSNQSAISYQASVHGRAVANGAPGRIEVTAPARADFDGDGVLDDDERAHGTDPYDPASH